MTITNFANYLQRVMAFSVATFGPGRRQAGIIDHIEKELREIKTAPDGKAIDEWVDVIHLGLDGAWRELDDQGVDWDLIPTRIAYKIARKQSIKEQRKYPDWRTAPYNKAIEHVRDED